jgi:hypothetical protein
VAVLGLTAAFVWGTIGTITALDRVDSYDRTAVPGQVTVSVTAPGDMVVYYESPADQARYAEPAATGRPEIPYNPATEATTEVRHAAATPTWQQLGVTVIGPDGAVPVRTYRSSARYDVTPGQLGRAVAKFHATTVGEYRVSAARPPRPARPWPWGTTCPGPSPRQPWVRPSWGWSRCCWRSSPTGRVPGPPGDLDAGRPWGARPPPEPRL